MYRTYEVTGVTKKNGYAKHAIVVLGENAKEARAIALAEWERVCRGKHLFDVKIKRTEECTFGKTMWHKTGESINGHWVEYV